jgi:ubiquinone/menaquinone biosynthesis C-methylase UbiE
MKELLEQDAKPITDIMFGIYYFQYLAAAIELDLFTLLSREPGLTRQGIASRLDLQENPTRILLLGCGSIGLLRKEGDRYYNAPAADRFLSKDRPGNFAPAVRMVNHIAYRPMACFYEALKANTNVGLREIPGSAPTLYMRLSENPRLEAIFHEMMGGISEQGAAALVEALDLSRHRNLLDVGGAEAVNAMALARRWPELHLTILDLPSVAENTRARIQAQGLSDRVTAVGLDCFTDELPKGFDGIMFSRFLGIWSEDKIRGLLAKAGRALHPGGSLFLVETIQDDDEMGGPYAAHLSAYFLTLASGEGMIRTWAEWTKWMEEAGFRSPSRRSLPGNPEHIIEGVKA